MHHNTQVTFSTSLLIRNVQSLKPTVWIALDSYFIFVLPLINDSPEGTTMLEHKCAHQYQLINADGCHIAYSLTLDPYSICQCHVLA